MTARRSWLQIEILMQLAQQPAKTVTELAERLEAGAGERAIMKQTGQTGHTSRAMVDRSIRDGDLFRDNAAARIGL